MEVICERIWPAKTTTVLFIKRGKKLLYQSQEDYVLFFFFFLADMMARLYFYGSWDPLKSTRALNNILLRNIQLFLI